MKAYRQGGFAQYEEGVGTLRASGGDYGGGTETLVIEEPILLESNQNHATIQTDGICTALPASMGMGGGYVPMVTETYQSVTGLLMANSQPGSYTGQDAYSDMLVACASSSANAEITINGPRPSLLARAGTGGNNMPNITKENTVRRLTPLECERLQGYPDGWTDIGEWIDSKGKKHKEADSPRYKALGNSIALPFWCILAKRISAQYDRDITMGSLFDGISGFCLSFLKAGARPLWTSEVEEFPIAVCKKHFGDEETGEEGDVWKYLYR